jgi:uroporphyrinogen-III synthase
MKLLIIRPEPGATASAARAEAAGFKAITLPFFGIRPRPWVAVGPYDAIMLTSANAIRHANAGLDALRHLPVHAVGERTAAAARSAGLSIVSVGKSDAMESVRSAAKAGHKRLLWLTGEDHRNIDPPDGISLDIRICYASEALSLPTDAKEQIIAADAIALHSPRAAKRFREAVTVFNVDPNTITIAAFSAAIAEAAGDHWRAVVIADMANDSALLSALKSLGTQSAGKENMI